MKKLFLIVPILLLLICGCATENEVKLNDNGTISLVSAKELINDGALLIDVRSEMEFNSGHIDGAILMPVESINKSVAESKINSKETVVIVYCRSGARSASAAKTLTNLGYTVYDLGAMSNWE